MNKRPSNEYFDFVFTGDCTTGLFNHDVNDIYHSSYGAKNEAIEKFIAPLKFSQNFSQKKEIKLLDICYGIGYNTKAFLNETLKEKYNGKLSIDILEYDKTLALLSPFIKDGFFSSAPEISYALLTKLLPQIIENKSDIIEIVANNENKKFIEPFYRALIKKYRNFGYTYAPQRQNKSFLHNIYYHCISRRNKRFLNGLKIGNFPLATHFDDARNTIKTLNGTYDIVFLDAFTPTKLPTLWSIDFFKELHRLTNEDSMIVTYSNSVAVRHAMLDAGFYVGKLFDKRNKACGTCATKKMSLIENKLDEYDLGLIKTNAGVYFKDKNLCNDSNTILINWQNEKEALNLESSGHYIKKHKRECTYG